MLRGLNILAALMLLCLGACEPPRQRVEAPEGAVQPAAQAAVPQDQAQAPRR